MGVHEFNLSEDYILLELDMLCLIVTLCEDSCTSRRCWPGKHPSEYDFSCFIRLLGLAIRQKCIIGNFLAHANVGSSS